MKFKWKPMAARKGLKAATVGVQLEKIRTANKGKLTADLIVRYAKPKASPLHKAFEWNDTRAAKAYRLQQARHLIRAIVVITDESPDTTPVRAFVHITTERDGGHYTSIQHAMSEKDLRKQVVGQAWKELEDWRKRYNNLHELSAVFKVIDKRRSRKRRKSTAA